MCVSVCVCVYVINKLSMSTSTRKSLGTRGDTNSKLKSKPKGEVSPLNIRLKFSDNGATKLSDESFCYEKLLESNTGTNMKKFISNIKNTDNKTVLVFTSEKIPPLDEKDRNISTDFGWNVGLKYPVYVVEVPKDVEFTQEFCSSIWGGVKVSKNFGVATKKGKLYRSYFISRVKGKSWSMHMDYFSYVAADRRKSKEQIVRSLEINHATQEFKAVSDLKGKWKNDPDSEDLIKMHDRLSKTQYNPRDSIPINDEQKLNFNIAWTGKAYSIASEQQKILREGEVTKAEAELNSINTYAQALTKFVSYWNK